MDTTANAASPMARPGRLSYLAGCAVTAVFILSGIDLRAAAWGGLWLRDIATLKHIHYIL